MPGGTVTRGETDADGVYEAQVTKSDGTQVIVQVDESFAVTNVLEMPTGGAPGGPGGTGGHEGETPLTGTKAAKVKAAAEAEIPDGTVTRVETDADGVYEAHVTQSDGTEVIVQVNKRFAVTGITEMPAVPDGGQPPAAPGSGASST